MSGSDHRYLAEIYSTSGNLVGQVPMEVDWDPARESAAFAALRVNPEQRALALTSASSVIPLWHAELDRPYIHGFRVTLEQGAGRSEFSADFDNEYFRKTAESAATELAKAGSLSAGERFYYCVLAFPDASPAPPAPPGEPGAFLAEEVSVDIPIVRAEMQGFREASVSFRPDCDGDVPVFVHRQVLSEVTALSQQASGKETGGVLIGNLCRDPSGGDVFLVVTAQIPAVHCRGEEARLTFTAEAWAAVNVALQQRGTDEIILGWHHSHPVANWCRDCPPDRRRTCTLFEDAFSPTDRALHKTVFPRAWSLALLVSDMPDRAPSISLHGWRQGSIRPRGFHVLESTNPPVSR